MVTILPNNNPDPFGFRDIGKGLVQGFQQGREQDLLNQIISQYQGQGGDLTQDLLLPILQANVSPQGRKNLLEGLKPAFESEKAREQQQATLNQKLAELRQKQEQASTDARIAEKIRRGDKDVSLEGASPEFIRTVTKQEPAQFESEASKLAAQRVNKFIQDTSDAQQSAIDFDLSTNDILNTKEEGFTGPGAQFVQNSIKNILGVDFQTASQAEINAARIKMFSLAKQLFGGRLNEREIELINSAIFDPNDTYEATQAKARFWKKFTELTRKRAEIMDKIIEENGGTSPPDLDRRVLNELEKEKNKLFSEVKNIASTEDSFVDQRTTQVAKEFGLRTDKKGYILLSPKATDKEIQLLKSQYPEIKVKRLGS